MVGPGNPPLMTSPCFWTPSGAIVWYEMSNEYSRVTPVSGTILGSTWTQSVDVPVGLDHVDDAEAPVGLDDVFDTGGPVGLEDPFDGQPPVGAEDPCDGEPPVGLEVA